MNKPMFMHGPWHFAGSGIIANDDDEEIGLSAVYDDDPNGQLIIAAPDLFAAVVRAVTRCAHLHADDPATHKCPTCEPERAALAKAVKR